MRWGNLQELCLLLCLVVCLRWPKDRLQLFLRPEFFCHLRGQIFLLFQNDKPFMINYSVEFFPNLSLSSWLNSMVCDLYYHTKNKFPLIQAHTV